MQIKLFALALIGSASLFAQDPAFTAPLSASSTNCTALSSCLAFDPRGTAPYAYTAVGIAITGTWAATIQFEGTIDCTTWFAVSSADASTGANSTSTTANGSWVANVNGYCSFRARVSAYTSGTATVTLRPAVQSYAPVNNPSFTGTATIGTTVLAPDVSAVPLTFNPVLPYSKTYTGPSSSIRWFGGTSQPCSMPYCLSAYFDQAGTFYSGVAMIVSNKRSDILGTIQGVSALAAGAEPSGIAYSPDINGPGLAVEMYTDGDTVAGHNNQALLAGYDLNSIHSGSGAYSPGYGRKRFSQTIDGMYWGNDLSTTPLASATTYLKWRGSGVEGLRVSSSLETTSTTSSDNRGLWIGQYNAGTDAPRLTTHKARGTLAAPTVITSGDLIGEMQFNGYDGSAWVPTSQILFGTQGTIGSLRVPSYISFLTSTDASSSVRTEAMRIDAAQRVSVGLPGQNAFKFSVSGTQNANDILSWDSTTGAGVRISMIDAQGQIFTTGSYPLKLGANNALTVNLPTDGGIQVLTAAQPTCDSAHRFVFHTLAGGAGVKDVVEVCTKDAADAYAWRAIY